MGKVITQGTKKVKEDDIVTKGEQISCTCEKFIALLKRVFAQIKEFNRKIEL